MADEFATVYPAFIGAGVAMVTLLAKDFLFARHIERFRAKIAIEATFDNYTQPVIVVAKELRTRLNQELKNWPVDYLAEEVLDLDAQDLQEPAESDRYYRRYKATSTLYRLCAFLGWIELYRQDSLFTRAGHRSSRSRVADTVEGIKCVVGDWTLHDSQHRLAIQDQVIFREEQRAIGQSMIVRDGDGKSIMNYDRFTEVLACDSGEDALKRSWIIRAGRLLWNPRDPSDDFRYCRIALLACLLVDLIENLDKQEVTEKERRGRERWWNQVERFAVNYDKLASQYRLTPGRIRERRGTQLQGRRERELRVVAEPLAEKTMTIDRERAGPVTGGAERTVEKPQVLDGE